MVDGESSSSAMVPVSAEGAATASVGDGGRVRSASMSGERRLESLRQRLVPWRLTMRRGDQAWRERSSSTWDADSQVLAGVGLGRPDDRGAWWFGAVRTARRPIDCRCCGTRSGI